MPLSSWVSIAAVAIAALSLFLARKDRQSQKTIDALRDLRTEIDGNKREIERLNSDLSRVRQELLEVERENTRLRKENYELLGSMWSGEDRVPPDFDGTERRRRRRG